MALQQKFDAEAVAKEPIEPFVDLPRPIREDRPAPQPAATDMPASPEPNVSNNQAASSSSTSSNSSTPSTSSTSANSATSATASPPRTVDLNHFYPIDPTHAPGLQQSPSRFPPPRITPDEQAELGRCDRIVAKRRWRSGRPWWRPPA